MKKLFFMTSVCVCLIISHVDGSGPFQQDAEERHLQKRPSTPYIGVLRHRVTPENAHIKPRIIKLWRQPIYGLSSLTEAQTTPPAEMRRTQSDQLPEGRHPVPPAKTPSGSDISPQKNGVITRPTRVLPPPPRRSRANAVTERPANDVTSSKCNRHTPLRTSIYEANAARPTRVPHS